MQFLNRLRPKILRTRLYGDQLFTLFELELLHTPVLQRLYNLKQLGFTDRVYRSTEIASEGCPQIPSSSTCPPEPEISQGLWHDGVWRKQQLRYRFCTLWSNIEHAAQLYLRRRRWQSECWPDPR